MVGGTNKVSTLILELIHVEHWLLVMDVAMFHKKCSFQMVWEHNLNTGI